VDGVIIEYFITLVNEGGGYGMGGGMNSLPPEKSLQCVIYPKDTRILVGILYDNNSIRQALCPGWNY
jgi:hypothetical protein